MSDDEPGLERTVIQLAHTIARMLRQPKTQMPPLTDIQRRHHEIAARLLEEADRPHSAEVLATATQAARRDEAGPAAQWNRESEDLAKKLGDPRRAMRGAVGSRHPGQAWQAAELVAPKAGTQRAVILDAMVEDVRSGREQGLTPAEAGRLIHRPTNQANTRMQELRGEGEQGAKIGPWIQLRGDHRNTTGSNESAVHELTMIARQRLGLITAPPLPL